MKLVVAEAETAALRAWLAASDRTPVSCDLPSTELLRAVHTFEQAGRLGQTVLRTLDAVHLAAALDLADDLDGMVTYDDRLAEAAQSTQYRSPLPPEPRDRRIRPLTCGFGWAILGSKESRRKSLACINPLLYKNFSASSVDRNGH